MIWMTWRQFRTQAVLGIAALLLLACYLLILGEQIRHTYNTDLALCAKGSCSGVMNEFTGQYDLQTDILGYVLIVVPAVIGMFWGVPLIARELEAGTHRLAWNQTVTRGRWLAAKLGLVGLAAVAFTGLYSLLLTWAASPLDAVHDDRFTPLVFDDRNIVPLAYGAFAFVLGMALGLFIGRTVPAMAAVLVVFVVVQGVMPTMVRPHYLTPVSQTVALTKAEVSGLSFFGEYGTVGGVHVAGGPWIVSTSAVLDRSGQEVGHTSWWSDCVNVAAPAQLPDCISKQNVHVEVTLQPAGRYWTFQWYETGIFALFTAVLAGLCFWRIRGRLS
ncbi:ABC transporter permease subunit [Catenulispora sp. NF23]|uniref:ABC transporter permease subunit n=1 Tax=Catenulispora pinistramenti TaxID=2705254 RepID=UPI001BABBACD|nr:ABC transporter permease subunit [Catenulispora pinistramenti]MBS2536425.1 ABC transporter permease subunit [Catenulispora pinistramenti]